MNHSSGKNAALILKNLPLITRVIKKAGVDWNPPVVGLFSNQPNAAFKILVSTILSLRTKDQTTLAASNRLFERAQTPAELLRLSEEQIQKLIFPVGFYRVKAKNLIGICKDLIERFDAKVPDNLEALLSLKGVGRKTANLVLTEGFKKPGICVDTHVHRISNRWGLVKTKTPNETEEALRNILPKRYWIGFNDLLVSYGQNLCAPVSPFCSKCPIKNYCPKIGVTISR